MPKFPSSRHRRLLTTPQHAISKGKIDKLSNPLPSVVAQPQDEIPSYVSNKETPTLLKLIHNATDLATAHVARELEAASLAASGAIPGMAIAGADLVVGRIASEINNVDNPITLIGSQVSSLLQTLSKFNKVVGNIATV